MPRPRDPFLLSLSECYPPSLTWQKLGSSTHPRIEAADNTRTLSVATFHNSPLPLRFFYV